MQTKQAIYDFPIPEDVEHLFGEPPILSDEDEDLYWTFLQRVVNSVKPTDIVEWLWLKDCVDLSWEILRFRRVKTRRENSCELLTHSVALTKYERFERLLTSAELRRDRILREIEFRRDHMGRRLRAASNEMLDGQVSDVQVTTPRIAAV